MVVRIAEHITKKLIMELIIEEDDRELYCYGFFLLTTRLFFFLVTAATGLIAGVLLESILFYTVFMLLRTYAGGVHAKTETACTILTTLTLAVSVFGIKAMELADSKILSILLLVFSGVLILVFSPVDSTDKPLTRKEKQHYRKICNCLVFAFVVVALCMYVLELFTITLSIGYGIFLESILLIAARIDKLHSINVRVSKSEIKQ